MSTVLWDGNKADGADTDWTSVGVTLPTIASNRWVAVGSTSAGTRAHGLNIGKSITLEWDAQTDGAASNLGLWSSAFNGYLVIRGSVTFQIGQTDSGGLGPTVWTGTSSGTGATHIGLTIFDNGDMQIYENGVQVGAANDSTYPLSTLVNVILNHNIGTSAMWVDNILISNNRAIAGPRRRMRQNPAMWRKAA